MALSMIAIAGSLYVLFAFTSVHGENPLARRVASVVNANDFSSRNRLASYEGALRMLEDKPWYGFGWGMPERIYGGFYSAPRLNETMALETNDYFVLGTTLGIPALACLGTFIWFGFTQNRAEGATHRFGAGKMLGMDSGSAGHAAYADEWMRIACRAAVIVLLVGFWFDGGLFKLPTAATFWIFLELGRKGAQMPE